MTASRRPLIRPEADDQPPVSVPGRTKRQAGVQGRMGWLFVVGTPAPQGSKRHVGNGRMIESSKAVAPWRQTVAWAIYAKQMRHIPGPVEVRMNFYLARPKSAPKKRTRPDRKPDIDKLARSTLDAIVEAGWIEDDARVVTLTATKHYAEPGQPTGVDLYVCEES